MVVLNEKYENEYGKGTNARMLMNNVTWFVVPSSLRLSEAGGMFRRKVVKVRILKAIETKNPSTKQKKKNFLLNSKKKTKSFMNKAYSTKKVVRKPFFLTLFVEG